MLVCLQSIHVSNTICRKCFSLNTTLFMFICELVEIKILSDKRWFLKKI